MHATPFLSFALLGANSFKLAQALEAREDSETALTTTESAASFSFTAHTRHTIITTTTLQATSSAPKTSATQHPSTLNKPCEGERCVLERCRPEPPHRREQIDWSLPCWAMEAIRSQCEDGPDGLELWKEFYEGWHPGKTRYPPNFRPQPPELIKECECSSQYADMIVACGTCFEKHGADADFARIFMVSSNATLVQDTMSEYCDVDATPWQYGFQDGWLEVLHPEVDSTSSGAASSAGNSASTTSSIDDPIGNVTDVSLYYTLSTTRTPVYLVDMPTGSIGDDETRTNAWYTYSKVPTSDGQIVPTAQAVNYGEDSNDVDENSESDGGTATAAAGAMQTAMAFLGSGAGVLGVAVLAVAL